MAAAAPESKEDLDASKDDVPILQSWNEDVLPDAAVVGFELQPCIPSYNKDFTNVPTKEALFKILTKPLLVAKKNAKTDLDHHFPTGMAPARVRTREALRRTLNTATAAVASTRTWLKTRVPNNCKITQRWVVVESVDTHFGSYDDKELEVCIDLYPNRNDAKAEILESVIVIRSVLGHPLATMTEGLGS